MILYRVAKSKYREDLSGRGAYLHGGRWNNTGVFALYTSEHLSLALLEIIAQARRPHIAEEDGFVLSLKLPEDFPLETHTIDKLPKTWRDPARDPATQLLGNERFEAGVGGLRVPSTILPSEWNVVLNPLYPHFADIEVVSSEPLDFDARLVGNR